MPYDDFLAVRRKMVQDFNKRAKDYHAQAQEYETEKMGVQGSIQKDINTALQKLRAKSAMELQDSANTAAMERQTAAQDFAQPLQQANIGNILQETKSKAFDLRLGMDYSGDFLERARRQKGLLEDALRKQLGVDKKSKMKDKLKSFILPQISVPSMSVNPLSKLTSAMYPGLTATEETPAINLPSLEELDKLARSTY